MSKKMIGIRHGEALHNLLGKKGLHYEDTTLTANGMRQALIARRSAPSVDVVLCSPLIRALQTASIIFPNGKITAVDCLMEYPQNKEICNRRSSKRDLQDLFPNVDFRLIDFDNGWDVPDAEKHLNSQIIKLKKIATSLFATGQTRIVAVTHSSWLKKYLTGSVGDVWEELPHCTPLSMDLN
jgi:broad specificity phosphatase PhoE